MSTLFARCLTFVLTTGIAVDPTIVSAFSIASYPSHHEAVVSYSSQALQPELAESEIFPIDVRLSWKLRRVTETAAVPLMHHQTKAAAAFMDFLAQTGEAKREGRKYMVSVLTKRLRYILQNDVPSEEKAFVIFVSKSVWRALEKLSPRLSFSEFFTRAAQMTEKDYQLQAKAFIQLHKVVLDMVQVSRVLRQGVPMDPDNIWRPRTSADEFFMMNGCERIRNGVLRAMYAMRKKYEDDPNWRQKESAFIDAAVSRGMGSHGDFDDNAFTTGGVPLMMNSAVESSDFDPLEFRPQRLPELFGRLRPMFPKGSLPITRRPLPEATEYFLSWESAPNFGPSFDVPPYHHVTYEHDHELGIVTRADAGQLIFMELAQGELGAIYSQFHNVCHAIAIRAKRGEKIVIGHAHVLPSPEEDSPGRSGRAYNQFKRVITYLADQKNGLTHVQISFSIDDRLYGLPATSNLQTSVAHLVCYAESRGLQVEEPDVRGQDRLAGWIADTLVTPLFYSSMLYRGEDWRMAGFLDERYIKLQDTLRSSRDYQIRRWPLLVTSGEHSDRLPPLATTVLSAA